MREREAVNQSYPKWVSFTRRTNDPKLGWLQRELDLAFISNKRMGKSFHAPILHVRADQEKAAWDILTTEIDNMPDDDPMFVEAWLRTKEAQEFLS